MSQRMNKAARQHRIVAMLESHQVHNQAHLVELLAADGVSVNQATVSRDLDELGAIKIRVPGGDTAYAVPELPFEQVAPPDHLRRVLGEWVVQVERSGDLLVVRTPPGSAHVVGAAIDRSSMDAILGTVAGDDTLLVVAREGDGAPLADRLAEFAGLK